MKIYYLAGPRKLELRDEPIPALGSRDILVKTSVSAISVGTEVWRYTNFGHYGGEGGQCGYNALGTAVEIGSEVRRVQVGDLVFATHPHAEYMVVREDRAVKLPKGIDTEAAAFTYLPTLGLHALRSAGYQAGDNVVVIGLGIVGVLAAQLAAALGARVAALEIDAERRGLGSRLLFGPVFDPRDQDYRPALEDIFDGLGPDIIIETSQSWHGLLEAVQIARPESRIAIVGIYRRPPEPEVAQQLLQLTFMNRDRFHNQHLKFIGCSNDPPGEFPVDVKRWTIYRNMHVVAHLIQSGQLDTKRIITHRLPWHQLDRAYDEVTAGKRTMVGAVLHWE